MLISKTAGSADDPPPPPKEKRLIGMKVLTAVGSDIIGLSLHFVNDHFDISTRYSNVKVVLLGLPQRYTVSNAIGGEH